MADFAKWGTATETAYSAAGAFMAAYDGNRTDAVEGVIDADPVATAVRSLIVDRKEWSGTATNLLEALAVVVGERTAKSKA